ncbi:lipopolysaccharide assembly protein LapB [Vibrio sp. SS-MA-C1-2]|uniref:lipopolysaccharide assembly protein LapB n=1 Tax=Vibrio sp. SS-MA-C1-2 TaxID=2908646 RepID=UPI001F1E19E9|nr:lipopolysaccharide assembly protein LapB [Vibrio sp. SS-MA-C1-2]UJF19975.1 lipopolysaccharide assembly protein LapB [Vibrio sp. SS-MA-C1-2]
MLELLFLLLPIAAAYGWYMGYRSAHQKKEQQSNHMSRQYVAGLNLLLSDQADKAVDHFIDLLQVDSETIDTHLALGNLFRSRGEVDRAIKLHQNLIARTNLSIDEKNLALEQLAKDYFVAGFFDRAVSILDQLVDEPEHQKSSLQQLLTIYQQMRDWDKAIEVANKLIKLGQSALKMDIAHFYCELAIQSLDVNDIPQAKQRLKKAINSDKACVRAALISAQLAIDNQDFKLALKYLEPILELNKEFISEALPLIEICYAKMDKELAYIKFLQRCIDGKAGATAELQLAEMIDHTQGVGVAQSFLTKQLVKNPTMKGFYHLMDYHLEEAEDGRAKESLTTLRKLVGEQLKIKPHYRCVKCGFSTRSLYWHCPSCKGWGTVKPIRGLDGE